MSDYTVIAGLDAKDYYADSDVPGEFRPLSDLLGTTQIAVTLIRVPPHSDFERSTGHYHDEIEEVYIISKGELTMRFNEAIVKVPAGSAVRVAPKTVRSHRNEGDEMVEMWALSKKQGNQDATKVDDFWEASEQASQTK